MIIVFGSVNMDIGIRLDSFPEPGETVLSRSYKMGPGGKGANQALAAVRAASNAKVALIGRVGNDDYGKKIREELKSHGVMVSGVAYSDTLPTGCAVVAKGPSGEKQTMVMTGANDETIHDQVPDEILLANNVLLMQMEVPLDQSLTLLERAHARGVKTILNLAPAVTIPKRALGQLDYLIVNSIEARQIAQKLQLGADSNAIKLAQALAIQGQMTCIITLGKQGAVAVTKTGEAWSVPIMPLDQSLVVDTVGAGDAYCGTFAAAIHAGTPLPEAMRRASVAGSLACTKEGAQPSLPFLDDIEKVMGQMPAASPVKI